MAETDQNSFSCKEKKEFFDKLSSFLTMEQLSIISDSNLTPEALNEAQANNACIFTKRKPQLRGNCTKSSNVKLESHINTAYQYYQSFSSYPENIAALHTFANENKLQIQKEYKEFSMMTREYGLTLLRGIFSNRPGPNDKAPNNFDWSNYSKINNMIIGLCAKYIHEQSIKDKNTRSNEKTVFFEHAKNVIEKEISNLSTESRQKFEHYLIALDVIQNIKQDKLNVPLNDEAKQAIQRIYQDGFPVLDIVILKNNSHVYNYFKNDLSLEPKLNDFLSFDEQLNDYMKIDFFKYLENAEELGCLQEALLNDPANSGNFPLMVVVKANDQNKADTILDYLSKLPDNVDLKLDHEDHSGATALDYAISAKNFEVAKRLIILGASKYYKDGLEESPVEFKDKFLNLLNKEDLQTLQMKYKHYISILEEAKSDYSALSSSFRSCNGGIGGWYKEKKIEKLIQKIDKSFKKLALLNPEMSNIYPAPVSEADYRKSRFKQLKQQIESQLSSDPSIQNENERPRRTNPTT